MVQRQIPVVVGFYVDNQGTVRPITKSQKLLLRTKVILTPSKFKAIMPAAMKSRMIEKSKLEDRLKRDFWDLYEKIIHIDPDRYVAAQLYIEQKWPKTHSGKLFKNLKDKYVAKVRRAMGPQVAERVADQLEQDIGDEISSKIEHPDEEEY